MKAFLDSNFKMVKVYGNPIQLGHFLHKIDGRQRSNERCTKPVKIVAGILVTCNVSVVIGVVVYVIMSGNEGKTTMHIELVK